MRAAVQERVERERAPARRARDAAGPPHHGALDAPTLLRLQAAAGNVAVQELVDAARDNGMATAVAAPGSAAAAPAAAATTGEAPAAAGAPDAKAAAEPAAAPAPAGGGQAPAPADSAGERPANPQDHPGFAPPSAGIDVAGKAPAAAGAPDAKAAAEPAAAPAPAGGGQAPASSDSAGERPANPQDHPGFQQAVAQVKHAGGSSRAHAPARAKAAEAQGAAVGPANEVASQAKAAHVDEMGNAKPKGFDKAAFVKAVQDAVARAAPQNLEQADDFKSSGKAGKVKEEVGGVVGQGKDASQQEIKQTTAAPPDTGKAKPKEVTPMAEEHPGAPPPPIAAAGAMPPAATPDSTNLDAGPAQVNAQLSDANVTEQQLADSNEPEFTGALQAKQEAEVHSAEAPKAYRAQEKDVLAASKAEAETTSKTTVAGMHGKRTAVMAALAGDKGATKSEDEARRAKVAADVESIYEKTKTDVQAILDGLDKRVDSTFDAEEKAAREQFENYVDARMNAYKDDRYSGWTGGLKWAKDKLFGMPDEVNVFYTEGRDVYVTRMNVVIGKIADMVAGDLTAATTRIAQGRAQVAKYVSDLPNDLKKLGQEASDKIQSKFDSLDSDVEAKQNELVDSLAQKYAAAQKALEDRITEMKEANKGLVSKVVDAVKGVIETILKLKDMLLSVLARAAEAIGDIIAHPIRFLENLVGAVKTGLGNFVSNIATHLENALMDWLFGAVAAAGIVLPKKLDFQGILDLVLQILGLTYQSIRARVVKIVGEPVVSRLEQVADVFVTLVKEGPAGLWKWIVNMFSSLEDMVLGQIKSFVTERVIKAGITWLIGILNPAAAFIKACKAIYDIVMFIVERGKEIMEFVDSILDSIVAIAKGGIGGVAALIEKTLAKILPIAISFLASLLGLGGISEKIKEIIDTVRKPIMAAVDKLVMGAVKWFKSKFGGAVGAVTGAVRKGTAFVKQKVAAGTAYVKQKAGAAGQWAGEKLGLVKAEQTLAMSGEGHTLTATGSDGSIEITMASRFSRRLVGLLDRAITSVAARPDRAALEGPLRMAHTRAIQLESTWASQTAAATRAQDRAALRRSLDTALAEIAAPLQLLPVTDLEELFRRRERRYMPKGWIGKMTRNILYTGAGSGWAGASKAVRKTHANDIYAMFDLVFQSQGRGERTPILTMINELVAGGKLPSRPHDRDWTDLYSTEPSPEDAARRARVVAAGYPEPAPRGQWTITPAWVEDLVSDENAYHVDHKESLAQHWTEKGYASGDAERWHAATDPANLELITREANLRKGAKDADEPADVHRYGNQKWVGDEFRSVHADGGIANAAHLDDRPFTEDEAQTRDIA